MKKKILTAVLATAMTVAISMTAWAGQWQLNGTGWWYDNGNGTWPTNTWQWIDDGTGTAKSYYFDGNGYCLMGTTTPDGYTVDPSGAWTVNGVVQTKQIENIQKQPVSNVEPLDLFTTDPVAKKNVYYHKEYRAKIGGQLSNVIRFAEVTDGYAEYYAGGTYTQFTASAYAPERLSDECEYVLEVYGDNDSLLFESDTLNYRTSGKNITVDITNQQYIKIVCHQTESSPSGNSGIILKDAQFK